MDTELQLGTTPEELVENFTKSETRFPAYMALQELGADALGSHPFRSRARQLAGPEVVCDVSRPPRERRIVRLAEAFAARPQDGRATLGHALDLL